MSPVLARDLTPIEPSEPLGFVLRQLQDGYELAATPGQRTGFMSGLGNVARKLKVDSQAGYYTKKERARDIGVLVGTALAVGASVLGGWVGYNNFYANVLHATVVNGTYCDTEAHAQDNHLKYTRPSPAPPNATDWSPSIPACGDPTLVRVEVRSEEESPERLAFESGTEWDRIWTLTGQVVEADVAWLLSTLILGGYSYLSVHSEVARNARTRSERTQLEATLTDPVMIALNAMNGDRRRMTEESLPEAVVAVLTKALELSARDELFHDMYRVLLSFAQTSAFYRLVRDNTTEIDELFEPDPVRPRPDLTNFTAELHRLVGEHFWRDRSTMVHLRPVGTS